MFYHLQVQRVARSVQKDLQNGRFEDIVQGHFTHGPWGYTICGYKFLHLRNIEETACRYVCNVYKYPEVKDTIIARFMFFSQSI